MWDKQLQKHDMSSSYRSWLHVRENDPYDPLQECFLFSIYLPFEMDGDGCVPRLTWDTKMFNV